MSVKKCPVCQHQFECKADSRGCWCEHHTLSTETLAHLRDNYTDCLCPACLQVAEQSGQVPSNNAS